MTKLKELAYSLGAIATALSYQTFATYLIFFYVDIVKLPPYLAVAAMAIYGIWNAINDPLLGYISDHTHSRWGRRTPYLAIGAIPFGLLYFLLWVPPFRDFNQVPLLFIYFLAMICLFDAVFTLTMINWAALFPEMFPTLEKRSQVNARRQSFGLIGIIFGISLPPLIYSSLGWGWLGAIYGLIITLSILIALWGSHEDPEYSREKQLPLFSSFKATLDNRSFLTFVFSNLFIQFTFVLILASIPFFSKYILHEGAGGTTALLAAAFLPAIIMLFIWQRVVIKVGAKIAYIVSIVILMLTIIPLYFVASFEMALLAAFFLGIGFSGFLLVVDLLLADIIDEDELMTGTRREGLFFGANAFITRFAIALEAFCLGSLFMNYGYNPYVYTQPRAFINGLRLLMVGYPLIALAVALLLIVFYPLAGKKLAEKNDKIKELHLKKGVI